MPTWKNLKVFALGLIWAALGGMAPATTLIYDDLQNYADPIDWHQVLRVAEGGAFLAGIGYWRKHIALLTTAPEAPTQ